MRRPDGGAACKREVNQHRARGVRDERYAIVVVLVVVLRQRIVIVRSRVGANTRGRAAVGERRCLGGHVESFDVAQLLEIGLSCDPHELRTRVSILDGEREWLSLHRSSAGSTASRSLPVRTPQHIVKLIQ